LLACLLLFTATLPAAAQGNSLPDKPLADPDQWLSQDRWGELRYGLTIREPKGATRIADTAQGDVMRWALPDGTRIRLSFARGEYEGIKNNAVVRMPAKVDLLKKQLGDELKVAVKGEVINTRADQVVEVGPLVGLFNYFIIKPDTKGLNDYLYGVALLQLDDDSVIVLKVECPPDAIEQAASTFECMVQSIQVQSVEEVNRRIHGWLSNGEQILKNLTQDDRRQAMHGDRLYRVIEAGRDIGYLRTWQRFQDKTYYAELKARNKIKGGTDKLEGVDRFEVEGNAVVTQSHLEGSGASIDRLFESIDAAGQPNSYWQIKSTMRYKNDPNNLRAGSWVETGVRGIATIGSKSMDHIQITREGTPPRSMVEYVLQRERDPERRLRYPSADPRSYPSGDLSEQAWPTPGRAFLTPVDSALMPALLPNIEQSYCFSAYDPEATRVDIRYMRVQPRADGGKTVYLRAVLDQSEQVLEFDKSNELTSHAYPDGREIRITNRAELARIWGTRLKD